MHPHADYMQFLFKMDPKIPLNDLQQQMRLLSRIIKAMRKDLGLSNWGLGKDGENVLKARISDFEMLFKS